MYIRVQPRKVRIIADEVRGKNAMHTVSLLRYHTSKGAFALNKVLVSAIANAQENASLSPESLRIKSILVDAGPTLKRMQARAMGRGNRILKKTSHITVVVEDYEVPRTVRPHGTKPKPRPSFGHAGKGKKAAHVAAAPVAAPVVEEAPIPTDEEIVRADEAAIETSEALEAAVETSGALEAAMETTEAPPAADAEAPAEEPAAAEPAPQEPEAEEPAPTDEAPASEETGAE